MPFVLVIGCAVLVVWVVVFALCRAAARGDRLMREAATREPQREPRFRSGAFR